MSQRYNDTSKYGDVRVTDLSLREKTGRVMLSFRLCMVLKKAGSEFIEDMFIKEVKAGKYFASLQIIEGSVEIKAFGKSFSRETARKNRIITETAFYKKTRDGFSNERFKLKGFV